MSTRGVFVFADYPAATFEDREAHSVYVHCDCYPQGAARYLAGCLASRMVWPLPRYEADEFAAGFIASIKAAMRQGADARAAERAANGEPPAPWDAGAGGNTRLMHRWDEAGDVAWAYLSSPPGAGS